MLFMLQSKEIIRLLEDEFVRSVIQKNKSKRIDSLSLKLGKKYQRSRQAILQILQLSNKASVKLPNWEKHFCGFTKKSLEQCSSEAVALARVALFHGNAAYDLTAGLGVDSWALATKFQRVKSVDMDQNLHELALYNLDKLQVRNVTRVLGDGIIWLKGEVSTDLIFIDPDRRDENGGRHVDLTLLSPNIIEHFQWLSSKAKQMYIKLSPLTDPTWLRNHFKDVSIVAISSKNEIKEIGIFWEQDVNLKDKVIVVRGNNDSSILEMTKREVLESNELEIKPNSFLWEPQKAIRILGYQESYLADFGVSSLGNTKFGISEKYAGSRFEGRVFQVKHVLSISWKRLKKELTDMGIQSCHIIRSNFPEKTSLIRKRLGVPEGDDAFLIFLEVGGKNLLAVCQRV